MKLFDTHCHLCHPRLESQLAGVLDRGRAAGVVGFVCASGNVSESERAAEIARTNDDVFFAAGVHPHDAKDVPADYLKRIEQLAADPKNVAIGEIGLDYHHDFSPRPDQQRIFAEQLDLAEKLAKPIVVHTREAFDDTLGLIDQSGADGGRVVFHSFTESADQLRRVLDIGAMISFSGIVTFKNTSYLRQVAALVPDEKLLLETDAPFLSPEPVRKIRTNEPAHIAHVAVSLGAVRGVDPDALAELTTRNAIRFFGLQGVR